jgi:hypothetical protein
MQRALDANLEQLTETNQTVQQSIEASAGNGMADAMRTLARAVDVLSRHLADSQLVDPATSGRSGMTQPRRAA